LRSQILAALFARVQRGEMQKSEAATQLDYVRGLPLRLLGDRVFSTCGVGLGDLLG
jgi:hypothetical protein